MRIIIDLQATLQELEIIFGKEKDIPNAPDLKDNFNLGKIKDLNGVIIEKGKYRFSENTDAQRNTDRIKFDERMRGLICYTKYDNKSTKSIIVSIPAQKGWETPVETLEIEPNWIEKCS